MKHTIYFLGFILLAGGFQPACRADIVKRSLTREGVGTVQWIASGISDPAVDYRLVLNGSEIWRYEFRQSSDGPLRLSDPFRHSQLIDIHVASPIAASFLLSGYEEIYFVRVQQVEGVWKELLRLPLFGIGSSINNPLKSIRVTGPSTLATQGSEDQETVYEISLEGKVTQNGAPFANTLPGAIRITVEPPAATDEPKP